MNQDYTDIIQPVSQVLLQTIKEREVNLAQNVEKLDSELAKLLRLIGLQVISMLLNGLAEQVTQEAKKPGLVVHRCSPVKYSEAVSKLGKKPDIAFKLLMFATLRNKL
ncbi:MAG TPA: hypothetical protein V6C95_10150 [Coleofasciculaceae cyanobacterium]